MRRFERRAARFNILRMAEASAGEFHIDFPGNERLSGEIAML
jgi:hypothetical protein